jgi:hypothetical protein
MRSTWRDVVGLGIPILLAIVAESVALRLGSTGELILGVLGAMIAMLVIIAFDLAAVGYVLACACAATLTWNGWIVGGFKPPDALIFGAFLCFILAGTGGDGIPRLPWWIKTLAWTIAAIAFLHILFPVADNYLNQRVVFTGKGKQAPHLLDLPLNNLIVAFKFIVAVALIPLVFGLVAHHNKRAPYWLGFLFGVGTALSGWAAGFDRITHIGVSKIITGYKIPGGRQIGFAGQPNYLAAGLVLAIPFAIWLIFSARRRDRLFGLWALPGLILGVWASGSRGGAVCAVFALGISILSLPRARKYTVGVAMSAVAFVVVLIAVLPKFGRALLKATRLVGDSASTVGSDYQRSLAANQGHKDFFHSPLYGIGLQASFDASQVYLQELASGGLLLFIAMQIYMGGWTFASYRAANRFHLAGAIGASAISALALNFFEADLTDRFYYVPAAILVALGYAASRGYTSRDQDVSIAPPPLPSRPHVPPRPATLKRPAYSLSRSNR